MDYVVEVGPGMGVLTGRLLEKFGDRFFAIEIDSELFYYLKSKHPALNERLFNVDFLKVDLEKYFPGKVAIIGNFPYNISSQIVFKIIEHRNQVETMVGMFQKEMAKRIVSPPGSKDYGIISVFAQCYYKGEYLFEIPESAFHPPPKVKSAVIKLMRNEVEKLPCDEKLFSAIVKTGFNQRRKKLRNSLSRMINDKAILENQIFDLRPEQLSIKQFLFLTDLIQGQ